MGSPTTQRSRPDDQPRARPRLIRALDLAVAALGLAAMLIGLSGGFRWHVGSMRVSMTGAGRLWLAAAVLAAVRWWLAPRAPLHPWFHALAVAVLRRSRAEPPLEADRPAGQPLAGTRVGRGLEWLAVTAVMTGLTVFMTWPQAANLYSVPDLGDPLFSVWRLAWVAHQLPRDPLHLFDANIFYPESRTLAFSDAMLIPALAAAPWFWAGVHQLVVYNLLFLASFVASGVATYALVRSLTGHRPAALLAGVAFAFHPYRFEHFSHLELQMTLWMPLALLWLHRTFERRRIRDGVATGALTAMQALSSLYYGVFLLTVMAVMGAVHALAAGRRAVPWRPLAAALLVVVALVGPLSVPYLAVNAQLGDRSADEVRYYSPTPQSYLVAHERSRAYAGWLYSDVAPETCLFPGLMLAGLALVGAWPTLSVRRIAYLAAGLVAFEMSLGMNGVLFPLLREYCLPFRGLRVPGRFSIVVGLMLAVLAAHGVARLGRLPWPRLVGGFLVPFACAGVILFEARPRIVLEPVWREPPTIYRWFEGRPQSVIASFPFPKRITEFGEEAKYLYFSTFHWQKQLNGNSGHYPRTYLHAVTTLRRFPNDETVIYLRRRGVQYIVLHGAFMEPADYAAYLRHLDYHPRLEMISRFMWMDREAALYRVLEP